MNNKFGLIVFLMVTCPGPKINGIGAHAEGVRVAIAAAIPINIAYIPILVEPPFNNATPMLKKIVIVTTFDKKFVITTAPIAKTMTTIKGFTPENKGCKLLLIQTLIPVSSEVIGVDITQTTPAKIIAPIGRDFNAEGISKIGLSSM